jgi:hypothetical protein
MCAHKILIGQPEKKIPLEKLEDNMKLDLK